METGHCRDLSRLHLCDLRSKGHRDTLKRTLLQDLDRSKTLGRKWGPQHGLETERLEGRGEGERRVWRPLWSELVGVKTNIDLPDIYPRQCCCLRKVSMKVCLEWV